MRHVDWNNIPDSSQFSNPAPGGYIAQIVNVEDVEDKEYLRIEWDFVEAPYKGYCFDKKSNYGYWPIVLIRSYKEKALPFFKGFKTAVEKSNRNYVFNDQDVRGLRGKYFGVVLGEEEYIKRDGSIGTRLYVAENRSTDAIKSNDYSTPELKKLENRASAQFAALDNNNDLPWDDTDEEVPF